jgi:hypothetical protein
MAITSIKLKTQEGDQNLMFTTTSSTRYENVIEITIYICDDNFAPQAKLQETMDKRTEEEYHIQLRKEAHSRDQFINQHSTNPEWNESFTDGKNEGTDDGA